MARTSIVKWMGSFILIGLVAVTTAPAQAEPSIDGKIPRGSPFSKIAIDMPQKQVYDLIGPPSETREYETGKGMIPFYFGNDIERSEAHYKRQGRITFKRNRYSGISKVYRIEYDPTEDGYAK